MVLVSWRVPTSGYSCGGTEFQPGYLRVSIKKSGGFWDENWSRHGVEICEFCLEIWGYGAWEPIGNLLDLSNEMGLVHEQIMGNIHGDSCNKLVKPKLGVLSL